MLNKLLDAIFPYKKLKREYLELMSWNQKLFSEKHEMIMEDRKQINEMMSLFHEKHEMILEDKENINKMMSLFHEKHEMILADRREINYLLRSIILDYYSIISTTDEQTQVLNWIRNNSVQMYPYDFYFEYMKLENDVYCDADGWKYILYKNKRLYFPRKFTDDMINRYFRFLIMEQDKRSPHCYFDDNYSFTDKHIIIDVGAAEGLIALMNIDKAKRIYLIECENDWCEALEKTFLPYKEKVTIINKIASTAKTTNSISLNSLIQPGECYIIKIDVEGSECDVLNSLCGATLKASSKIVACAYHNQKDEQLIAEFFKHNNVIYTNTPGYLLSDWGGYKEPYLRRGLLRGYLNEDTVFI